MRPAKLAASWTTEDGRPGDRPHLADTPKKPWSGVFQSEADPRVEKFTESVSFDRRLYAHDVLGSIAHAQMLATVGVLSADEARQIVAGLAQIGEEINSGAFEFRQELE